MSGRTWRAAGLVVLGMLVAAIASAQTVEDLVAKNLKARGGLEVIRKNPGMRLEGTLSAGGQEYPLTILLKRPNLVRQDMEVQGQTLTQAFDGEHAWALNPMMGQTLPQEIHGPQADMMRDQSDFDGPLVDYQSKGYSVALEGEVTLSGRKAWRLKITKKNGQVQRVWLDGQTGLEVKSSVDVTQGEQKFTIETLLTDYRAVDGLMVPFSMETIVGGRPQAKMTFQMIVLDPKLDVSAFRMPK